MAGSATLYTEQAVLGHTLNFATMTRPSAVYVSLTLAAPTPDASNPGSEVAGNGYARQPATFALTSGSSNIAANTGTIAFPAATAGWGGVGYFALHDAPTGGNRLYWGPLVDPADGITPITRNILSGDIVRFTAGVLEVIAT